MKELLAIATLGESLRQRQKGAALATVIATHGSTYRKAGARLLIGETGETAGVISGGCTESDLYARAKRVIEGGRAAVASYTPADDDPLFALGGGCGGEMTVLIEPFTGRIQHGIESVIDRLRKRECATVRISTSERRTLFQPADAPADGDILETIEPPLALLLFGAGADARPLAAAAGSLGWRITVIDPRGAFARREHFPDADEIIIAPYDEAVKNIGYDVRTAAVVMTHNLTHDKVLAASLLSRGLRYVGLLGPRSRKEKLLATLAEEGRQPSPEQLRNLFAPAGIDLGGSSPREIALSIAAEIEAVMNGGSALHLRDRNASIHDRSAEKEIAVIVLAAGGSTRLGRPKQLVVHRGVTLLRAAAAAACAVSSRSCVVLGARAAEMARELKGLPATRIVNRRWKMGIGTSIACGLRAVRKAFPDAPAVLLMLSDQPAVGPEILRKLMAAFRTTEAPLVASWYPDGAGVPALFGRELFPALELLDGDNGARELIRKFADRAVVVGSGELRDVDVEEDAEKNVEC